MTSETLEALRRSIAKYRAAETEPDEKLIQRQFASDECPLCALFCDYPACNGCPVEQAGCPGCCGSPWWCDADPEGRSARMSMHIANLAYRLRAEPRARSKPKKLLYLRRRCRQEAEFLESLLPAKKTKSKPTT